MSFVEDLEQALEPFKMLGHENLQRYVRDGMPIEVARRLAKAYGPVNAASPSIMAAGLARISSHDLFLVLLRNLWEECGEGVPTKTHVEMFNVFSRAVDIEPSRELEPESSGFRLVYDFINVCRIEPEHCVIAMFHGFEATFPYICNEIAKALAVSRIVDPLDATFFSFHAVHDLEHARTTREAMLQAAKTNEQRADCLRFTLRAARRIRYLFEEVFA
jgi:pyrroloquinoline quinone (PQQ) biosynthesis protein C